MPPGSEAPPQVEIYRNKNTGRLKIKFLAPPEDPKAQNIENKEEEI